MPSALTHQHNPSLADLHDEIHLIDDMIDAPQTTEEMRSELRQRKEQLIRVELPRKTDGIAGYDRYCDGQILVAKEMRDLANAGIKRWTKRKEDLRNLVKVIMQITGTKSYKGALACITLRPPSESVEVFSKALLPLEYFHPLKPPELMPDLDKIKRDLRAEIEVPGARLIEGDDVLMIR